MNIWYFSAYDRPHGHSSRTYDYACELRSLGHSVSIFTNSVCHYTQQDAIKDNRKWVVEYIDGLRVVWLKTPRYFNTCQRAVNMLYNYRRALQAGKKMPDKPDIIIGPTVPLFTGWAALKLAVFFECPFFIEIRDIWPQTFVDLGKMSPHSPIFFFMRMLEKKLYNDAHTIVSTLPLGHVHVKEIGCDPEKVIWIPNGVNLQRFEHNITQSTKKSSFQFVYMGSFSSGNNILPILDAANILKQKKSNWSITLIGKGRQQKDIEKRINELSLNNKIHLKDIVPKKEVAKILSQADATIYCLKPGTLYRFGSNNNKLYDYFAAGKPIIFSGEVPQHPVKISKSGFTVASEDSIAISEAMLTLLEMSPEERKKLGSNARKYAYENFDVRTLAKKMEHYILKTLSKKNV